MFIDGLDECQPDDEQVKLVDLLTDWSSQHNVKILASSRPWPVFLERLTARLETEQVNRTDLLAYTRVTLESADSDSVLGLKDVGWACILLDGQYREPVSLHDHSEGHRMVQTLLRKAEGVFLWLRLVTASICERLSAGESADSLARVIDELPGDLEEYFKQRVCGRIASTYTHRGNSARSAQPSVTAMALTILCLAIRAEEPYGIMPYWILMRSRGVTGASLLNPNFLTNTSLTSYSRSEVHQMVTNTRRFLEHCCKDLVRVTLPSYLGRIEPGPILSYGDRPLEDQVRVAFIHRSVLDFLETAEMRSLLKENTPEHFREDCFYNRLLWVRTKYVQDGLKDQPAEEVLRLPRQALIARLRGLTRTPDDILDEVTSVVEHYYLQACREGRTDGMSYIPSLCYQFAKLARYELFDLVVRTQSWRLCVNTQVSHELHPQDFVCNLWLGDFEELQGSARSLACVLKALFQAGMNPSCLHVVPGFHRGYVGCSLWAIFLGHLERHYQLLGARSAGAAAVTTESHHHFDPALQVIWLFLEYGADVSCDVPICRYSLEYYYSSALDRMDTEGILSAREILMARLPLDRGSDGFRRLEKLQCQVAQEAIWLTRLDKIQHWPSIYLTDEDIPQIEALEGRPAEFADLSRIGDPSISFDDVARVGRLFWQKERVSRRWKHSKKWLAFAFSRLGLPARKVEWDQYLGYTDGYRKYAKSVMVDERCEIRGDVEVIALKRTKTWSNFHASGEAMPQARLATADGTSLNGFHRCSSSPDLSSHEVRIPNQDCFRFW